jgi:hypothetical protein
MSRRPVIALALAGTALLVAACSAGSADAPTAAPSDAPAASSASSAPASEPSPSASVSTEASAPAVPSKPSAADMATDRFADAVLEQLKIDSADTFSDQLITIALSPLMRQLASTAELTTRVASKGDRVTLTLAGTDGTCIVTVTDKPQARGVVCKPV